MGRIFIACVGRRVIIVYDAKPPYNRLDDIEVKELEYPRDIAACSVSKSLYISDKLNCCVWRVASDKPNTVCKLIGNVTEGMTLQVMSDGNILLINELELVTYKPDGTRMSALKLPEEIKEPVRAIEKSSKSFIVCYGMSPGIHKVCELSKAGNILREYGSSSGSETFQMDWPVYATMDQDGRLFVLDANNFRILLLDSKLRLQRVLLTRTEDKMEGALRISYAPESGNLFIGTLMPGSKCGVYVYNIRNMTVGKLTENIKNFIYPQS